MTQSASAPLPASVLEALARYDTPTICNAMEIVAPERRLIGYTTKPLVCPFPDLPPMVGYARTVTIRSVLKSGLPAEEQRSGASTTTTIWAPATARDHGDPGHRRPRRRLRRVLGRGAQQRPQGARLSRVITDGSIRDIPQWAPGFQALAGSIGPSHAWVHAESFAAKSASPA